MDAPTPAKKRLKPATSAPGPRNAADLLQHLFCYGVIKLSRPSAWALSRAVPGIWRARREAKVVDDEVVGAEEAARESGAEGTLFAEMLSPKLPTLDNAGALRMMDIAASHGNLPACEVLFRGHLREACPETALRRACLAAAEADRIGVMRWAAGIAEKAAPNPVFLPDVLKAAAARGHLALLHACMPLRRTEDYCIETYACVARAAAEAGHLEVVRWTDAARARELRADGTVLLAAARGGHLHVLEWLLSNDYNPHDPGCCTAAARNGHAPALMKLRAHRCPFDVATTDAAALHGDLEMAQWLLAQGCPLSDRFGLYASIRCHIPVLQWIHLTVPGIGLDASVCYFRAARAGCMETLDWLHAQHFPIDSLVCPAAAAGGHTHVLQWALERGCQWDKGTTEAAAAAGQLQTLQWALASGCPADMDQLLVAAAGRGKDECVYWAHAQGAALPDSLCALAAANGRMQLLQWARQRGCPWGDAAAAAAKEDQLELLQWAHAAGCPWDGKVAPYCARREEIERWAARLHRQQ